MLISAKIIEPMIRWFGLNSAINLGFLALTIANFALWLSVVQI